MLYYVPYIIALTRLGMDGDSVVPGGGTRGIVVIGVMEGVGDVSVRARVLGGGCHPHDLSTHCSVLLHCRLIHLPFELRSVVVDICE